MLEWVSSRSKDRWLWWALFAITFVSSTAIVAYHAGTLVALAGGFVYTVAFAASVRWLLDRPHASSITLTLESPVLWLALLTLMAAIDQHHYLRARQLPNFATSAEALERPARLLLHGEEPYRYLVGGVPAGPSVDQAPAIPAPPISPGPGWVMLLLPLTVFNATGFLGAVSVAVIMFFLAERSRMVAGAFLLLLLPQPVFFFQVANGEDLYVISIALVIIALLAERVAETGRHALWVGLLAAFIATSRVPILLPLSVIGFGCFLRNRRAGLVFLASSLFGALALHLSFAAWAHHNGHFYQPMHVFHRGAAGSGLISRVVAVALLSASAFWIVRKMPRNAAGWCIGAFLVMMSTFLPEAGKELTYARALNWEGSTYVTFPVPLLIAAIVLRAHTKSNASFARKGAISKVQSIAGGVTL